MLYNFSYYKQLRYLLLHSETHLPTASC